jgi:hypothetical protein
MNDICKPVGVDKIMHFYNCLVNKNILEQENEEHDEIAIVLFDALTVY